METVDQLLQRAVASHKAHDLSSAEILYKKVLDQDPNNVDATHYLALIAQDVDRYDIAIVLLEKASSLSPEDANIHYNLGLSLQHMGRLEEAKLRYIQTIKLRPQMSLPYNNLGVILQQEGQHEKASHLFEKAIVLDPSFADAYYNLSNCESYQKKPPFLDKLEALLDQTQLARNNEIVCHFALGKIYDDIGLYDQAFEHYKKGNDLKETSFNIRAYENYVNSIKEVFRSDHVKELTADRQERGEIIFIVGMPRSGTTLVEQIIASHPEVTGGGEMGLIGGFIDDIGHLSGAEDPYPTCLEHMPLLDIHNIANRVAVELEKRLPGHGLVTDKTPINFLHIGFIHLLYPKSKIIYCRRNPLDNCLSCYFQNFNRQHHYSNDLKLLGQFYNLHADLMHYWHDNTSAPILDVDYEKLVSAGETEIRRIIEFSGLEWNERCLRFNENKGKVKTASNWQVRQPLYNSSVQRWKHYESHIQELIDTIGYTES